MWVAGLTLRPAGLTGGVWLKYADSWADAGVNRGAERSWRWALGGQFWPRDGMMRPAVSSLLAVFGDGIVCTPII